MTIGYLAAGKCWSTSTDAVDAYYSHLDLHIFMSGSNFVKSQYLKDSAVWKMYNWATPALGTWGTPAISIAPTNVYGSCTLEESTTGWNGTYDYAAAAAAWSFAFTIVLGTWMLAKNFGIIINAIRRW